MAEAKQFKIGDGEIWHYSVGAVIESDGRYLLMDRNIPPWGFAGIAGHVDDNETPEQAIDREVNEESGLEITSKRLLFDEMLDWNWCSKGIKHHRWYLFACEVKGGLKGNEESKSIGWYTMAEIGQLKLEPVWEYWFKKLGIK